MKKNVLITGATGMLGATLVESFQEDFNVFATGSKTPEIHIADHFMAFDLSISDYTPLIEWSKPDVIIHCAALTNGNYCEQHPSEAFLVNGITLNKFTKAVAEKTHIIYISTDAVFSNDTHYASEDDHVNPESVYGKSKEIGEFFLTASTSNYTIVRTTIVGTNRNSNRQGFVEWIVNSSKNNIDISLFDDVKFTPISIWNMANQLKHIIQNPSNFSRKIVHVAGSEIGSKYQFGIALLKALNLQTETIKCGKISDFKDRAKRSTDQTLNCKAYEDLSKTKLPNLTQTIQEIKDNYHETN
ncbi:MAG: SDR family oxidoreductase [Aquaticitalea sp.]